MHWLSINSVHVSDFQFIKFILWFFSNENSNEAPSPIWKSGFWCLCISPCSDMSRQLYCCQLKFHAQSYNVKMRPKCGFSMARLELNKIDRHHFLKSCIWHVSCWAMIRGISLYCSSVLIILFLGLLSSNIIADIGRNWRCFAALAFASCNWVPNMCSRGQCKGGKGEICTCEVGQSARGLLGPSDSSGLGLEVIRYSTRAGTGSCTCKAGLTEEDPRKRPGDSSYTLYIFFMNGNMCE